MAYIFGQHYTRDQLMQRVGRLEQIARIEPCVLTGGHAKGTRAFHVTTGGGLAFTVAADRCLDIPHVSYNGIPLCWYNNAGVVAPQFYEPEGNGFLRSFFGGLLTTCGLRNFGSRVEVDGETFPMHGRIGNLPASEVSWGTAWQGDDCTFWIEGVIRESRLFGEDLTLRRRIEAPLGGTGLRILNTVRNEGYRPEGHMILFHMNPGFPLLDDGARLMVDPLDVHPRDAEAQKGLAVYDRFTGPQSGFAEQVFILDLRPDDAGYTTATLVNERLAGGLALRLRFPKAHLPYLAEWRMLGQGAYVLGLEPANCPTIEGRAEAVKRGTLPVLQPGEERHYDIDVDVLTSF